MYYINWRISPSRTSARNQINPNKFSVLMLWDQTQHHQLNSNIFLSLYFFSWVWLFLPLRMKAGCAGQFQALIQRLENTNEVPECTDVNVSDHGWHNNVKWFLEVFRRQGYFLADCANYGSNYAVQRAFPTQSGLSLGYWPLTSAEAWMFLNRLPQASNPGGCTLMIHILRRSPHLSFRVFAFLAYFCLNPNIPSFPAGVSHLDSYSGTGSLSLSWAADGMFVG